MDNDNCPLSIVHCQLLKPLALRGDLFRPGIGIQKLAILFLSLEKEAQECRAVRIDDLVGRLHGREARTDAVAEIVRKFEHIGEGVPSGRST